MSKTQNKEVRPASIERLEDAACVAYAMLDYSRLQAAALELNDTRWASNYQVIRAFDLAASNLSSAINELLEMD